MPLLQMLGQGSDTWPPYLADIIIELWQPSEQQQKQSWWSGWFGNSKREPTVRVLYLGKAVRLPGAKQANGESLMCCVTVTLARKSSADRVKSLQFAAWCACSRLITETLQPLLGQL